MGAQLGTDPGLASQALLVSWKHDLAKARRGPGLKMVAGHAFGKWKRVVGDMRRVIIVHEDYFLERSAAQ